MRACVVHVCACSIKWHLFHMPDDAPTNVLDALKTRLVTAVSCRAKGDIDNCVVSARCLVLAAGSMRCCQCSAQLSIGLVFVQRVEIDTLVEQRRELGADVFANNRVVVTVVSSEAGCLQSDYNVRKLERNGYQAVLLHTNPSVPALAGLTRSRGSWSTVIGRVGGVPAVIAPVALPPVVRPPRQRAARQRAEVLPVAVPVAPPPPPPDAACILSVKIEFHVYLWLKKFAKELDAEVQRSSGGVLYARYDMKHVSLCNADAAHPASTVCALHCTVAQRSRSVHVHCLTRRVLDVASAQTVVEATQSALTEFLKSIQCRGDPVTLSAIGKTKGDLTDNAELRKLLDERQVELFFQKLVSAVGPAVAPEEYVEIIMTYPAVWAVDRVKSEVETWFKFTELKVRCVPLCVSVGGCAKV